MTFKKVIERMRDIVKRYDEIESQCDLGKLAEVYSDISEFLKDMEGANSSRHLVSEDEYYENLALMQDYDDVMGYME